MRKQFYVEPEIEVNIFSSTGDVRTMDGDLAVSSNPEDDNGDFNGGTGELWGDIY